jgi:predicted nucleic acid-binding protein
VIVEPHHYKLARDWIGLFNTRLKSLDAIHLAIASSEGMTLVTADQEISESAATLSLDIMLLDLD